MTAKVFSLSANGTWQDTGIMTQQTADQYIKNSLVNCDAPLRSSGCLNLIQIQVAGKWVDWLRFVYQ